jgi:hypothetical protein
MLALVNTVINRRVCSMELVSYLASDVKFSP